MINSIPKLSGVINNPAIDPSIGTIGGGDASAKSAAAAGVFTDYMVMLWRSVITVGALLLILYLIWGAIEWITAGGDSGKIQKARDKMVQSVIGMIILASSFIIIEVISTIFFPGFDLLELTFPTPGS